MCVKLIEIMEHDKKLRRFKRIENQINNLFAPEKRCEKYENGK